MSAGIMENDSLFVVGKPAWHNLGTVLKKPVNSEDALRIAGLDWTVESVPLYAGTKPVDDMYANMRSDTKDILGIVTKKYKIYQNSETFMFLDDIMGQDSLPVMYDSAGSLFNGKKVWIMARIPDSVVLGDKIANYMFFSNSFDGKNACSVGITPIRIVCNNTLTMAVKGSPRKWSFKHMGSLESRKQEAIETLGLATDYTKSFSMLAEKMATVKVSDNFIDKLIPVTDTMSKRIKENTEMVRESIINLYTDKDDLQNFKGSAWGFYNAVADYVSNSKPLRSTSTFEERRFDSYLEGVTLLEKTQKLLKIA